MYENPSADKFEPPTGREHNPSFEGFRFTRVLIVILLVVASLVLHRYSREGNGWWNGIFALGALALGFVENLIRRKHSPSEEDDPYTPPTHLTR